MSNIIQSESPLKTAEEKFGHFPIMTASVNFLFKFLIIKLKGYNVKNMQEFKFINKWSYSVVGKIYDIVSRINKILYHISYNYPASGSSFVLRCSRKTSDSGIFSYHCAWYSSKNFIIDNSIVTNHITLNDSCPNDLIEHICFRICKIIIKFDNNCNCDYDFTVIDEFKKILGIIIDIANQIEINSEKLIELKKLHQIQ